MTKFDLAIFPLENGNDLAQKISSELFRHHVAVQICPFVPGELEHLRVIDASRLLVILPDVKRDTQSMDWIQTADPYFKALEKQGKLVIFGLSDEIDLSEIPSFLMWSYFLDFKTSSFPYSIEIFLDQIRPKARIRKEFLKSLRNPPNSNPETLYLLRHHILFTHDQGIQKSAILGLEKIGGPFAVQILTERLMNAWGCSAIERSMKGLYSLADEGGCFGLTATLFIDRRYFHNKIRYLVSSLADQTPDDRALGLKLEQFGQMLSFEIRDHIKDLLDILDSISLDDIRYGAVFAKFSLPEVRWAGLTALPTEEEYLSAIHYAEDHYPGISEILNVNLPNITFLPGHF